MADIFDWSTTPGSNSSVDGTNIAEGCPAGNTNDGLRKIMAAVRNSFASALETFLNGTAALPIANGGTAATSASAARTALGVAIGTDVAKAGSNNDITALTALSTAIAVNQGGTGATTASAALAALGGLGISASSLAEDGYVTLSNGLIVQWGRGSSQSPTNTASDAQTVTFPIPFPSAVFAVICGTQLGSAGNSDSAYQIYSVTTSQFRALHASFEAGSVSGVPHWVAIGN